MAQGQALGYSHSMVYGELHGASGKGFTAAGPGFTVVFTVKIRPLTTFNPSAASKKHSG